MTKMFKTFKPIMLIIHHLEVGDREVLVTTHSEAVDKNVEVKEVEVVMAEITTILCLSVKSMTKLALEL